MSFAAEKRDRGRPALPMAAMVDILFLLLIYFLTVAALREEERSIAVDLPQLHSAAAGPSTPQIILTVTADDEIFFNGVPYTLEQARGAMEALAAVNPHDQVFIRADADSSHGISLTLLDMARTAGFYNAEFAGMPNRPR